MRFPHVAASVPQVPRADSRGWITLAECSRLIGRHVNAVKSIALAGGIRTRIMPGARILYSRADAERLAAN